MSSSRSSTPSLTPSRSPTPELPAQPDHFYGCDNPHLPSPNSEGKAWFDPTDDPMASRGIPVFKPTVDEFADFETYMNRIECWGMRSGIVKVIPPKEWTDALPSILPQLGDVKVKSPIEQVMLGQRGLFRAQNIEKRKVLSVREWAEMCSSEDLRAPGVDDIDLHARAKNGSVKVKTRRSGRRTRASETAEPPDQRDTPEHEEVNFNANHIDDNETLHTPVSPPRSVGTSVPPVDHNRASTEDINAEAGPSVARSVSPSSQTRSEDSKEKPKPKRRGKTKEDKEALEAQRALDDEAFFENFDPHSDWLPPNTTPLDYTPDFCRELERRYWRNCGLGKAPWYGADLLGSLFTDKTSAWNVATLKTALTRLLPASSQGLPGVNTPYLYFGMWRATFAWHVEDMDLFSINYIHFGAPKFWYAMPQARAAALETAMKGFFPKDISQCPQFLRHKAFLASPNLLAQSACRPNTLVQRAGEFVITYPKGYHAGFNLGFNCAESVNFALDSWLDLGRKAKICKCVNYSVRIDVDQLLRDREAERARAILNPPKEKETRKSRVPKKRKSDTSNAEGSGPRTKKIKIKATTKNDNTTHLHPSASSSVSIRPKVTLRLGPKPVKEPDTFPCCLCVSQNLVGLLRVVEAPAWRQEGNTSQVQWMAHEECANVVPETWVDEVDGPPDTDGLPTKERVVFGVDVIVKDRWNLKCSACTRTKSRAHGAPIQCTKGRCPRAFHVSCAREGSGIGIVYRILRMVEKDVVLVDPLASITQQTDIQPSPLPSTAPPPQMQTEAMTIDPYTDHPTNGEVPDPTVLKIIRKAEVECLCHQHNPMMAEIKRQQKQDKIRNELVALPPMARIKVRVSTGVFEVSLVRVIEEEKAVEVLWDRGIKREFKWGSVILGNTEGVKVVGSKPSEVAPEILAQQRSVTSTPAPRMTTLHPMGGSNSSLPATFLQVEQNLGNPASQSRSMSTSSTPTPSSSYQLPSAPYQTPPIPYQPPPYQPPPPQDPSSYYPQYQSHSAQFQQGSSNWTFYSGHPQTTYGTGGYAQQYYPPLPPQRSPYGSYTPHGYGYNTNIHVNATSTQAYGSPPSTQPQAAAKRRGLQWQAPYTGPSKDSSSSSSTSQQTTQEQQNYYQQVENIYAWRPQQPDQPKPPRPRNKSSPPSDKDKDNNVSSSSSTPAPYTPQPQSFAPPMLSSGTSFTVPLRSTPVSFSVPLASIQSSTPSDPSPPPLNQIPIPPTPSDPATNSS
ncbi:JHDM3 histone demethylase family protein [Abortiporus biennis]